MVGEAAALRPSIILTPAALLHGMAQASARASHAAQHLVVFDAPDVTPQTASLVADAAAITAEAIGEMARDPVKRRLLAGLNKVVLAPGRKAQATLDHGVLKVAIVPPPSSGLREEVVCRPSSRRIAVALNH
jgi:hypothetical protein